MTPLPRLSLALALAAGGVNAGAQTDDPGTPNEWTILVYGGSDNDSEESFCPDMEDLRRGLRDVDGVEVLCLVDRSADHSTSTEGFGEDFSDTRLYRLTHDRAARLDGRPFLPEITLDSTYEADSGDAGLVRDYIRYAKARHPAKRYAMIFYTHGNGWTWCPDETDGGALFPAELTDTLTAAESLDLIVFDVCEMASLEDVWQWRPAPARFSVDVMVATPMAGFPFPWNEIVRRLPGAMADDGEVTAERFGALVVEETARHRAREYANPEHPARLKEAIGREAMACIDARRAGEVKQALDAFATLVASLGDEGRDLLIDLRGTAAAPRAMTYNDIYVDVHDLAARARDEEGYPEDVRALAGELADAVDAMVLASFGGAGYDAAGGFRAGQSGVQLVFPPFGIDAAELWEGIGFLSPGSPRHPEYEYGRYAFCRDGGVPGDGAATNWFELLDQFFDADDEDGGRNGYAR